MTDIEYWDGELAKKLDELEQAIKALKKVFGGDKEEVGLIVSCVGCGKRCPDDYQGEGSNRSPHTSINANLPHH